MIKKKLLAVFIMVMVFTTQVVNVSAISIKDINKGLGIKNIIVMIPDGTSAGSIALSRWYKAYDAKTGLVDKKVSLAIDELVSGSVRTFWEDANGKIGAIVDSAPAASAMATGKKTYDKHVSVSPCKEKLPYATILEASKLIGKSTGLVASSNIQHATPAAHSSHYFDRSRFDIIAEQQVYQNMDVVFGGGSMYLTEPYRKDGEDLISELKSMGYQYITTGAEMRNVKEGRVWGMFAADAMSYELDRKTLTPEQPSLAEMTAKAIELLSQNEDGFFLMVEGSKVDWSSHANDPVGIVSDVLAFDDAVRVALNFAKSNGETMIIASTDHGNGGITIGNSGTNDSYSSDYVEKFIAPLKKATLTGEGLAAKLNEKRTNIKSVMRNYYGINDLTAEEETIIKEADANRMNYAVGPMISKRAHIGWTTTGHTGEDVTLYTYLPKNERVVGLIDSTDIALASARAFGVNLNTLT
ncbi:MAG: alkaline phosphatase, partial [Oscillospiraceae bacterium]|nr:alkaline phosphatase [Oscillospiraceae bacterium]